MLERLIYSLGLSISQWAIQLKVSTVVTSRILTVSLPGDTRGTLTIAAGTVFNRILLWTVGANTTSQLEPVRVSFNGHEVRWEQ